MTEYRQTDADGRIPLSSREYKGLRALFGAVNVLNQYSGELERRARGIKNGWRDLRCLQAMADRLTQKFLATVPNRKLVQIQQELKNTFCELQLKGAANAVENDCMVVEIPKLVALCKAAAKVECFACDKSHKEAKKACPIYATIEAVFGYDFTDQEKCPLADGTFE